MINAVIIDDEPLLVKSIAFMLQKYCPNIKIVGTAGSAITGKTLIESQKPDLVFLDIQMPMGNGFDLLDSFDNIDFHVIIISAFDNGNYTNIYLINGDKQLISKQLGEIEKLLSQNCFCRIHNEYIINTTKITNYTKGRGGYVTLINNIKLNVSAQKKNEFLAMYHPYKL